MVNFCLTFDGVFDNSTLVLYFFFSTNYVGWISTYYLFLYDFGWMNLILDLQTETIEEPFD